MGIILEIFPPLAVEGSAIITRAFDELSDGHHRFIPNRIQDGNDRQLLNGRVVVQDAFYFRGRNVLGRPLNRILFGVLTIWA